MLEDVQGAMCSLQGAGLPAVMFFLHVLFGSPHILERLMALPAVVGDFILCEVRVSKVSLDTPPVTLLAAEVAAVADAAFL